MLRGSQFQIFEPAQLNLLPASEVWTRGSTSFSASSNERSEPAEVWSVMISAKYAGSPQDEAV